MEDIYMRLSMGLVASTAAFLAISAPPGMMPANAADHREAPLVQEDPTADIADIYAFRSPNDSGKLVLVMTVNPLSVPSENVTYRFSPNVRYTFNIDNTGDAVPEHKIIVRFGQGTSASQDVRASFPGGIRLSGLTTAPSEEPEPNPPVIVHGPAGSGVKLFAGQVDDPFFFDIAGFFRVLAGTGTFSGTDGFAGTNVSAIVVEVPLRQVTNGRKHLQIWGDTARRQQTHRGLETLRTIRNSGSFEQVERMGNPAISTALIPSDLKDKFNVGLPKNDARDFAAEIVASLQNTFGTNQTNIGILAPIAVPDTLKFDLDQPDGYPNGRRLQDDVIDTLLFFIFNQTPVSDFVDTNDIHFADMFPFVGAPHQPSGLLAGPEGATE